MSDFLLQYHLSGFGTRRIESDPDWRFSAHTLADNDLAHVYCRHRSDDHTHVSSPDLKPTRRDPKRMLENVRKSLYSQPLQGIGARHIYHSSGLFARNR